MGEQSTYSKALDAFGTFVGYCFILVGAGFSLWGVGLLIDRSATVGVEGRPSTDAGIKALVMVAGLVVAFLGILLVRARPSPSPKRTDTER